MKQAIVLVNVGFGEYNGTDLHTAKRWGPIFDSTLSLLGAYFGYVMAESPLMDQSRFRLHVTIR